MHVQVRQQRVMAESVPTALGESTLRWPPLATTTEETRDGGGTLLHDDPLVMYVCMYACMHVCMFVCGMYVCMWYVCICMYVCMYVFRTSYAP